MTRPVFLNCYQTSLFLSNIFYNNARVFLIFAYIFKCIVIFYCRVSLIFCASFLTFFRISKVVLFSRTCRLFFILQFRILESDLSEKDVDGRSVNRGILRKSLCAVSPSGTASHVARSVCRQIAPDDEVFQFFTREASAKYSKVPLSQIIPESNNC